MVNVGVCFQNIYLIHAFSRNSHVIRGILAQQGIRCKRRFRNTLVIRKLRAKAHNISESDFLRHIVAQVRGYPSGRRSLPLPDAE